MRNIVRILLLSAVLLTLTNGAAFAQVESLPENTNLPMLDYNKPKRYIVNNVTVEGIKYIQPEIIAATSGIVKGDTVYIPGDYISSALRRMWNQNHFSDVQILTEPFGDSINITILLQESPRVSQWKIEGTSKSDATELLDKLKLKRNIGFSDYMLNSSKEAIRKFYTEKGFLNAEVTILQENDTIRPNSVIVTFKVDKNARVRIGKITFEGNEAFSDAKLRQAFKKTHQKSINFIQSSKYKEKEYAEDKNLLIDFYNSKGYRNANVLFDSIYKINDKRIGINIAVEEGNKFFIRDITWMGNSLYTTEHLNAMLGVRKGDTYDKKTLHKHLGVGREQNPEGIAISNEYQNSGYLFSQIEPAEIIVGEDSIDLNIKIFEGKQATVNEVTFTGNMRINDEVIRRDLYVRPGELYNQALLMETLRMLSQMGHFFPENLQPGINPISNDQVNITFPLEEQPSDKFEVSGGWGAGMFVGSVGIQLNNVSLRKFFSKDGWRPYPSGQNQQLAIRAQSNGSYYKALSVSFTEPWLGGKRPNSLSVSMFYSSETDAYYAWQTGSRHFRTIGASVGLGRRLAWPDRNFTLYNELGYQSYNLKNWTGFIVENGSSNIITLKTVFGRNTVDSPIFPRRGSDFSVSLALTPPYSLFQNIDFADPDLPDYKRFKWIEFHKWLLKGQWFYPLTQDNNLVLMSKVEMGYLGSYNKHKLSPFEGFDVGGDGMSGYNVYGVDVIRLRGYDDGSLTPGSGNDYARVYNKYTMELRYPIIHKQSSTIYALAFAEGGNGFADWKNFNPFTIKRSAGVGVRIFLPFVGMIGVDWGYGFDKAVGATKRFGSKVHFMIGQEF